MLCPSPSSINQPRLWALSKMFFFLERDDLLGGESLSVMWRRQVIINSRGCFLWSSDLWLLTKFCVIAIKRCYRLKNSSFFFHSCHWNLWPRLKLRRASNRLPTKFSSHDHLQLEQIFAILMNNTTSHLFYFCHQFNGFINEIKCSAVNKQFD